MPDYGLPLRFGTFVTPAADPPEHAVDLAVLSEELGFDLVTFQDHPYQPSFLDTWTLLTWTAARTSRIHLAANVHSLPMRPPAVLARSAASLDLLSGGRFELGLGAGAFWDAIESMGGRRLTPGQGVEALDEAIDVIRALWNVGERAPLRLEGEYYRLNGAKRGPAPAHDIPIWIGALKPRMLRLVGRKGDGWLPSFAYVGLDGLITGNATIDAAATAAGRDPREIRRMLNVGGAFTAQTSAPFQGPPEAWVDDLVALALEQGVATFILASDDPETMATFATEVVPEVRTRVDEERATRGTTTGVVRSSAALAARRPGIDYDGMPASLAATAVEPGDSAFSRVRNNYLRGGNPGLVLRPGSVDEVREALAFARAQDVPLGVRSGGHGISGRSTNDGGIVIDLKKLDALELLDASRRLVRVQPGARWIDVARFLQPHGWAITSGDYGGVGVGGLATAGGVGWFAREHGLTIDHVRAVELLTADGRLVRASAEENPDLFWGMRGAGAEFGIAVAFEIEAHETGEVGFAQLQFATDDIAAFLEGYGRIVEASPRDLTASLVLGPGRGGGASATILALIDSADPDTVIARLQPFAELAPLAGQQVSIQSYPDVMAAFLTPGPHAAQGEPHAHTGMVDHITPDFAEAAAAFLVSGATHFFQFRAVGGAVADVPADATAYAGREAAFSLTALSGDPARLDAAWDGMRPWLTGAYLSFETGRDDVARDLVWPAAHLARLRALKAQWDPEHVFADNLGLGLATLAG
ncbi:LLM class flavin-dependent oxidoreductase [Pseudolysinimonas sp.]|jgi:alkanesulfonate monooxygenase SsuD/methylene tetrahydromethanopterin reductase-like flavin-dependent oxidoreductase (luciferase family)/FAD/FMN-containing dehydrogenase|uniref:LLM class flavin-dependent oxidoreductase n=1 Tax=Pseudolysinimonas sp. TaxID=2680009 RepID=UPI0037835B5D